MEQWKALDELDAVSMHSIVSFYHSYYIRLLARKGSYIIVYCIISYYIILYYVVLCHLILYYLI